jgi:hypothetical protein
LIEAHRHHKHSYQQIKGTALPVVTVEEQHEKTDLFEKVFQWKLHVLIQDQE